MSEIAVPQSFSIPENVSMADSVFRHEKESPEFVAFERPMDGKWVKVSAREFADQVRSVAKGLMASGVEFGDRVAIHGDTVVVGAKGALLGRGEQGLADQLLQRVVVLG